MNPLLSGETGFPPANLKHQHHQPNQQQTAAIQIRQKHEQHLAVTLFVVTVFSLIAWLTIYYCSYNMEHIECHLIQ
jgi:Na+/melibiose symporter-like transporter